MLIRMLIAFCFAGSTAYAQCEPLSTVSGTLADSLISSLPRDSSTWVQLGTLYVNKVFLRETNNGQQDADSAKYYFEKALSQTRTPRLEAYYAIACALRARHDGALTKVFGDTKDRAKRAFKDAERLARENPHDLGVIFLVANLLQEGDALDDAEKYWKKSWGLLERLTEQSADSSDSVQAFFSPDIRANILLNQGKLIRKLVEEENVADFLARERWQAIIRLYPETLAATNAREQIAKL